MHKFTPREAVRLARSHVNTYAHDENYDAVREQLEAIDGSSSADREVFRVCARIIETVHDAWHGDAEKCLRAAGDMP